jgi:hypothetical protein
MFSKVKSLSKRIWEWFQSLKRWQQVLVVVILLVAGLSSGGDSTETSTSDQVNQAQATQSPEPEPEVTEEATAAPTPTATRTPETPIEFRFSALRDLGDMRKDLSDARVGITQNGLGKFYWNVAEVNINLAQLEILEPREQYAQKWNSKLEILKAAVSALGEDDEELTISKAKAKLDKVLNAIPALESIAKSLAN